MARGSPDATGGRALKRRQSSAAVARSDAISGSSAWERSPREHAVTVAVGHPLPRRRGALSRFARLACVMCTSSRWRIVSQIQHLPGEMIMCLSNRVVPGIPRLYNRGIGLGG